VLFTIPNIAVFFAVSLRPEILEALWLSARTPWGIITAAFLHKEAAHLLQNLLGFLAAVISFALSNLVQDRKGKERYSRIFLLAFPSGFLANAAELFVRWMSNSAGSAYGASGVVYSAIGICMASAVINACPLLVRHVISFRDPGSKKMTVPEILITALNLALIAFALYLILSARESFLNVSPGVDVFVHTAGFLIGFGISSALFLTEHA
jgi:membrane associated rhomboid family serine protease